jgi:hypothetical protein
VHGAVAADDDQLLGAAFRRLDRELGEVARPLGDERAAVEAGGGGSTLDRRPATSRRAGRRRRVDEEDDRAVNARR